MLSVEFPPHHIPQSFIPSEKSATLVTRASLGSVHHGSISSRRGIPSPARTRTGRNRGG